MQIFFLNHFESRKNDIISFWGGFTFLGFIVSLVFLISALAKEVNPRIMKD